MEIYVFFLHIYTRAQFYKCDMRTQNYVRNVKFLVSRKEVFEGTVVASFGLIKCTFKCVWQFVLIICQAQHTRTHILQLMFCMYRNVLMDEKYDLELIPKERQERNGEKNFSPVHTLGREIDFQTE